MRLLSISLALISLSSLSLCAPASVESRTPSSNTSNGDSSSANLTAAVNSTGHASRKPRHRWPWMLLRRSVSYIPPINLTDILPQNLSSEPYPRLVPRKRPIDDVPYLKDVLPLQDLPVKENTYERILHPKPAEEAAIEKGQRIRGSTSQLEGHTEKAVGMGVSAYDRDRAGSLVTGKHVRRDGSAPLDLTDAEAQKLFPSGCDLQCAEKLGTAQLLPLVYKDDDKASSFKLADDRGETPTTVSSKRLWHPKGPAFGLGMGDGHLHGREESEPETADGELQRRDEKGAHGSATMRFPDWVRLEQAAELKSNGSSNTTASRTEEEPERLLAEHMLNSGPQAAKYEDASHGPQDQRTRCEYIPGTVPYDINGNCVEPGKGYHWTKLAVAEHDTNEPTNVADEASRDVAGQAAERIQARAAQNPNKDSPYSPESLSKAHQDEVAELAEEWHPHLTFLRRRDLMALNDPSAFRELAAAMSIEEMRARYEATIGAKLNSTAKLQASLDAFKTNVKAASDEQLQDRLHALKILVTPMTSTSTSTTTNPAAPHALAKRADPAAESRPVVLHAPPIFGGLPQRFVGRYSYENEMLRIAKDQAEDYEAAKALDAQMTWSRFVNHELTNIQANGDWDTVHAKLFAKDVAVFVDERWKRLSEIEKKFVVFVARPGAVAAISMPNQQAKGIPWEAGAPPDGEPKFYDEKGAVYGRALLPPAEGSGSGRDGGETSTVTETVTKTVTGIAAESTTTAAAAAATDSGRLQSVAAEAGDEDPFANSILLQRRR
ncbi:MAG: hypothetical protein LQ340_002587 [Diploschistes diacapsis]|nr:MAG: hypothetical protein LQ340_002587 [Diploschistes diacapsis]